MLAQTRCPNCWETSCSLHSLKLCEDRRTKIQDKYFVRLVQDFCGLICDPLTFAGEISGDVRCCSNMKGVFVVGLVDHGLCPLSHQYLVYAPFHLGSE